MAFTDLDNPRPSRNRIPPAGVLVTTRESGPKDKRARYIAIMIGGELAKALHFFSNPQHVNIAIGNGQDVGKVRIVAAPDGKFAVNKMTGGSWQVTLGANAIAGRFKDDFERFAIERARIVEATARDKPSTIIPFAAAMLDGGNLRSAA